MTLFNLAPTVTVLRVGLWLSRNFPLFNGRTMSFIRSQRAWPIVNNAKMYDRARMHSESSNPQYCCCQSNVR